MWYAAPYWQYIQRPRVVCFLHCTWQQQPCHCCQHRSVCSQLQASAIHIACPCALLWQSLPFQLASHIHVTCTARTSIALSDFAGCLLVFGPNPGASQQDGPHVLGALSLLPAGGSAVSTALPSSSAYVVTYTGTDAFGNVGAPVTRQVSVYDQCAPQKYCQSSGMFCQHAGHQCPCAKPGCLPLRL